MKERGLTLVEVLVALTVSLVLLAGILQLYAANKRSFRYQQAVEALQENARYALDHLAREVRQAGYFGCSRSVAPENTGITLVGFDAASFEPLQGLQGWEAAGTAPGDRFELNATDAAPVATTGADGTWRNSLGTLISAAGIRVLPGSDVLRIWRGGPSTRVAALSAPGALQTITLADTAPYRAEDVFVLGNCQSVYFVQGCEAGGDTVALADLDPADPCAPGNDPARPVYMDDLAGATIAPLVGEIYFVGKRGGDAANPPALFRMTVGDDFAVTPPQEIVEGVDTMQIVYGVDSDPSDDHRNTAADRYVTADRVPDWRAVVDVRVGLLVRTPAPVADRPAAGSYEVNGTTVDLPVADRYLRRVYTATIALRNRML